MRGNKMEERRDVPFFMFFFLPSSSLSRGSSLRKAASADIVACVFQLCQSLFLALIVFHNALSSSKFAACKFTFCNNRTSKYYSVFHTHCRCYFCISELLWAGGCLRVRLRPRLWAVDTCARAHTLVCVSVCVYVCICA